MSAVVNDKKVYMLFHPVISGNCLFAFLVVFSFVLFVYVDSIDVQYVSQFVECLVVLLFFMLLLTFLIRFFIFF